VLNIAVRGEATKEENVFEKKRRTLYGKGGLNEYYWWSSLSEEFFSGGKKQKERLS